MKQSVQLRETKCSVKENKMFSIPKQTVYHAKTNRFRHKNELFYTLKKQ